MSDAVNPYQAPTAEPDQSGAQPLEGVNVTTTMINHLRQTRPWVRFLSVLGFVTLGLILFTALSFVIAALAGADLGEGFPAVIVGIAYIGLGVVYIFPVLYLNRFAGSLRRLLAQGTVQAMEEALGHQKAFWKFVGVLTLVLIGLAVIGMVVGIAVAIAS